MNIIELARKAGLRSAVLLDMYKTKDALTPSEELELEQYKTFANDVIAARDAELIAGVGEPRVLASPLIPDQEGVLGPLYTAAQVAGAVAKYKAALNKYSEDEILCKQQERIAELESERDMWKATAEAVVDFEKSQMRLRISTLESKLKEAVDAIEEMMAFQVKHIHVWNNPSYDNAHRTVRKINEVLHADQR